MFMYYVESLKKYVIENLAFIVPVAIFVAIFLGYFNYLPLWDGRAYFNNCILPGVANPFHLLTFNCTNHGALFYGLLYGALQYLSFGNVFFIHFTSLLLMLTAFIFLYKTLKILFHDNVWVMIGMAAVCWNPAIIANVINPTPDLVVLALSLMVLWCFLDNRLGLASLVGLALFFSKEAGVVYYLLCCFFYLLYYCQSSLQWRWPFKPALVLAWPLLIYAYFMWYKTHIAQDHLLFNNIHPLEILSQVFVEWKEPHFYSAINTVFILNFHWIVSAVFLLKIFFLPGKQFFINKEFKTILFISLLAVSSVYIFCQFPHVLNVRYYLLIFPLMTFLFIYTLKSFPRGIAISVGLIYIAVCFVSCFKTVDPVSKKLYGVFQFGQHDILKMTSETQECCGYGRDQLVYNLQHAKFSALLNQFSETVHLSKEDVILTHPLADYYIYANLTNNYRWTLKSKNTYLPQYSNNPSELLQAKHFARVFYLEFPNVQDDRYSRQVFAYFDPQTVYEIKDHGYVIKVTELRNKS